MNIRRACPTPSRIKRKHDSFRRFWTTPEISHFRKGWASLIVQTYNAPSVIKKPSILLVESFVVWSRLVSNLAVLVHWLHLFLLLYPQLLLCITVYMTEYWLNWLSSQRVPGTPHTLSSSIVSLVFLSTTCSNGIDPSFIYYTHETQKPDPVMEPGAFE